MTRFEGGPAKGQTLMLRRAARFLRVTESALPESGKTKWDALDQLDDQPMPDEKLHAYEIVGQPVMAFIDGTKCRGRYAIATYRLVVPQPDDTSMRTTEAWHAWTRKAAGL
jgi:hypothetical protein